MRDVNLTTLGLSFVRLVLERMIVGMAVLRCGVVGRMANSEIVWSRRGYCMVVRGGGAHWLRSGVCGTSGQDGSGVCSCTHSCFLKESREEERATL